MAKEIAVYIGENGETASLYEPGKIIVYRKRQGEWGVLKEKEFILNRSEGMKELRQKVEGIIAFLNECKIFVALSVVGVPYFELEKAGYSVWEFEGNPGEFLDYILQQEEEAQNQTADRESYVGLPVPAETAPGCYRISLTEIQANNSGVTSKQALLPFIRQGAFYSLEVLCNHVPPWLEAEFPNGSLAGVVERVSKDEIKVTITKKLCGQC